MCKKDKQMDLGEKIKKLEELIEKTKPYEKSQLAPFETQIIYCRKVKKMPYREIKTLLKESANVDVCVTTIERFYKRRVKKSPAATAKQPLKNDTKIDQDSKAPEQKTEQTKKNLFDRIKEK